MPLAKCRQCGEKENSKNMVPVLKGKSKVYVHEHCKEEYEKQQSFKQKETKELEDLIVNYVSKIHRTNAIPHSYYPLVQDLRNGTIRKGKIIKRQYKEGFPYPVIARAYLENWQKIYERINWSKQNGHIKNKADEFRIGLNVVAEQVALIQEKIEREKQAERIAEERERERAQLDLTALAPTENKIFRKPTQKAHDDISAFLD